MIQSLLVLCAAVDPLGSEALRSLAERYAPVIVQESHASGRNDSQDLPVPFDFDGNWLMTDNWANQPRFAPLAKPTVHYAVMTTERRVYLTYLLFYPRDWSTFCLPFICHENDLEQFSVVLERTANGTSPPLLMDVKYHRGERAYPAMGLGAVPRKKTSARMSTLADGRPLVRVEWGGHGILSCDTDGDGLWDEDCKNGDEAMLLYPSNFEFTGLRGASRARGYELVAIDVSLWRRRHAAAGLWSDRWLSYVGSRLGRLGRPIGVAFAGSGLDGGARSPWGVRAKDGLRPGDRFLDPALAINRRWQMPGGDDTSPYVDHPLLSDLTRECSGMDCDRPSRVAEP